MKFPIAAVFAISAATGAGHTDVSNSTGRAGEEVDRICFASSINRWENLGEDGHMLLVDRASNDWYRLEMAGKCGAVADFSSRITLETKPGSGCLARGDLITITDPGGLARSCRVKRINRWTYEKSADAGE